MLKTQLNTINELFYNGNSLKTCRSKANELVKIFKMKDLQKFKQSDIEKYIKYLKSKSNKSSTINAKLAYLSKCLKYYKNSLIMPYQSIKETEKSIISPEQFKTLQSTIHNTELKQFINIAYYTGMRANEILKLKKQHIKYDRGIYFINLYQTKNGRNNLIPVTTQLNSTLENFFEFSMNYQQVYYELSKFNINPHQFRHTFITRCFERNLNSFTVMRLVNQTSIQSTKKYVHLQNNFLACEVQKL